MHDIFIFLKEKRDAREYKRALAVRLLLKWVFKNIISCILNSVVFFLFIFGDAMSYETDLTDDQWAIIEALLTVKTAQDISNGGRPRTVNLRGVVNALFYRTKTGCQWRMIPKEYPKWNIVRYYHDTWTWNGQ